MSRPKPPYHEVIQRNVFEDPDWRPYATGEAELPEASSSSRLMATFLFYLGDMQRAKETSYSYSIYSEERYERTILQFHRNVALFDAALFRDLAEVKTEARKLWQKIIVEVDNFSDDQIIKNRHAHLWIYQAYAFLKLGEYQKVTNPAKKGFDWIVKGKGIDKAPHRNSREYGLADVLFTLSDYMLNPNSELKEKAQSALEDYKKENVRYGKLGYPVIFDLQNSYPDVFNPVLPGPDPEKD
jgi:hypothetical protein